MFAYKLINFNSVNFNSLKLLVVIVARFSIIVGLAACHSFETGKYVSNNSITDNTENMPQNQVAIKLISNIKCLDTKLPSRFKVERLYSSILGTLAVEQYPRSQRIWLITNKKTQSCLLAAFTENSKITSIALGADSYAVAQGSSLTMYSLETGKELASLRDNFANIINLVLDQTAAHTIMFSRADSYLYRWDYLSQQQYRERGLEPLQRYAGLSSIPSTLVMHASGRFFLGADWGGSLVAWLPYDEGSFAGKYDQNVFSQRGLFSEAAKSLGATRPASAAIEELSFVSDGTYFIAARQDGWGELWKVRGFKKISETQLQPSSFKDLSVSPSGNYLLSVSRDGITRLSRVVIEVAGAEDSKTGLALVSRIELVKELAIPLAAQVKFLSDQQIVVLTQAGDLVFTENL